MEPVIDTAGPTPAPDRTERRLVLVVGAIVFVDTMFYAAIAPLLPSLAHELHLSKFAAGVMTASYPLGTLLASVPAGVLAARAGPKFTVTLGLGLLAVSTLAFGFLRSELLLDVARLIEGVGGACSWSGGLAWIVAEAPSERRGALIGGALGAAIAGALFGPLIGTAASAVGRGAAFSGVVVVAGALIVLAQRIPSAHVDSAQGTRGLVAALRRRTVLAGMWLVTLPAIASGMISVLGPLRMHRLGATAAAIGAAFLVAAAIEAVLSPMIGRWSDRRGRMTPVRYGLVSTAVLLLCFTLPANAGLLAALIVATAAALGGFWAPAMAMLADAADRHGLDQGLASALANLAWAGGQILGSGVGGAVAKVAGDGLPMTVTAGLCADDVPGARRARTGGRHRAGLTVPASRGSSPRPGSPRCGPRAPRAPHSVPHRAQQKGGETDASPPQVQTRLDRTRRYLSSTTPASSMSDLSLSASALSTPSLTGFGASSTSALASLRPETRGGAHDLDHLDLLVARGGRDHVETRSAPQPPRRHRRRPRQPEPQRQQRSRRRRTPPRAP